MLPSELCYGREKNEKKVKGIESKKEIKQGEMTEIWTEEYREKRPAKEKKSVIQNRKK